MLGRLAGHFSDEQIAATLNRLGLRTGAGNSWNRFAWLRRATTIRKQAREDVVTTERRNGSASVPSVRRMVKRKVLPGSQVVPGAPWQIPAVALESCAASGPRRNRLSVPQTPQGEQQKALFSKG